MADKMVKKKIAHIICTYPPYRGGMGKVAREDARQLVRHGYDVTVFTPWYKYLQTLPRSENDNGVQVRRLTGWLQFGNAAVLPGLLWSLRKFDIIHLHYPFYGATISSILAKLLWRKPLVVHYHMDNIAGGIKGSIFQLWRYLILPQVLKVATKIVVHSQDYAFNCQSSWWFRHWHKKIVVIPNGVDTKFYHPVIDLAAKMKNKPRQLLFVGALDKAHYFKGLPVLFNALHNLQQSDWRLAVVGNGDMADYYRELAKRFRLEDKINFHHEVSDEQLRDFYSHSYLTILPSTTSGEAFGIVLIESMACQTAVVATNLAGVRSVVKDEQTGSLVPPNDEEALRVKLDYLLDQEALVEEMSMRACQQAKNKYDWNIIGKQLDKLYADLLNK